MKLIVDDSTLKHVGCHGLHIRYIGFGVASTSFLFKRFFMGSVKVRSKIKHQMVGWALIVGPWHIFWRSKDMLRREGYSWPPLAKPLPPHPAPPARPIYGRRV